MTEDSPRGESAPRRVLRSVLPICAALVAGFVGAQWAGHHGEPHTVPNAAAMDDARANGQAMAAAFDSAKVASLETRLAALEGGSRKTESPHASLPPGPVRSHSPEDRERRIAADYADHQQRIQEHNAESRNDAWAHVMEESVATKVRVAPEGTTFKYEGVDCRTATCVVNFSWPSRGAAEGDLRRVISALAATGCGRGIALPPANGSQSPESPTHATVLLTCGG